MYAQAMESLTELVYSLNEMAHAREVLQQNIDECLETLDDLELRQAKKATILPYHAVGAKAGNLELGEIMALSASMSSSRPLTDNSAPCVLNDVVPHQVSQELKSLFDTTQGETITHARWGLGKIEEIEEGPPGVV